MLVNGREENVVVLVLTGYLLKRQRHSNEAAQPRYLAGRQCFRPCHPLRRLIRDNGQAMLYLQAPQLSNRACSMAQKGESEMKGASEEHEEQRGSCVGRDDPPYM